MHARTYVELRQMREAGIGYCGLFFKDKKNALLFVQFFLGFEGGVGEFVGAQKYYKSAAKQTHY